jgi:peptidoglycan hydrolase CwlO-like protein
MRKSGLYIGLFLFGIALGVWGASPLLSIPTASAQELSAEQRAKLQAEYDQLQQEIAQWQKVLDDTRSKKNTLQGDVTVLDAQIKKAQAEISQRNKTITVLGSEINKKTQTIQTLEQKLSAGRESLAKLMRQKNEVEQRPLGILALSSESLSSFFDEAQAVDTINRELQELFDELRGVKQQTEKEKQELDNKKNAELDARYEVQVKQNEIKEDQNEKKQLLDITKKDEQSYSKVLAERQQRAEAIRSALFELRDAQGITFESALEYANQAEKSTGVRAALILAILRQESNLGANVGKCYLVDPATGAGKGMNSGTALKNVMHPTRDVPPFIDLVEKLGDNPYSTVVSCPQSVGYGGAMGPAQFIASTWKLYEKRLQSALGVTATDPWSPRHAVMAMGMFLKDLRADRGTYSAEVEAAGRYYAGGNWKTLGANYSKSVLKFAEQYQKDIDFLNGN